MSTTQVLTEASPVLKQPDISYTPDHDKYLARVAQRKKNEVLETKLPSGFPSRLDSPLVWDNKTIDPSKDGTYVLSPDDISEIEAALSHFECKFTSRITPTAVANPFLSALNIPLGHLTQETFPLPSLHSTLRKLSHQIHHGLGFSVLRGLPFDTHTRAQNLILFAGVSVHIAPIRGRQDHSYQGKPADVVLNHIKDLSAITDAGKIGSPAYTTEKQVFHTDSGDVIALACLEVAGGGGGESKLSSAWRVYNELAETRPDLIGVLSREWPAENFSGRGDKYTLRPLLHHVPATDSSPERMIIQYARRTFTGYWGLPRSSDIPPITEAQAEALDTLHFLAEKHAISLDFQKGDVQFANNLSIFHARDGFRDTPEKQRHLVRLWLRDPENAWPTPKALESRWKNVYDGVTAEKSVFPLEPSIRTASAGNSVK